MKRAAAPFQRIVQSFRPDAPATNVSSASTASNPASRTAYSIAGASEAIRRYRQAIASGGGDDESLAEAQASLAEALGWLAYLQDGPSPSELDEMSGAADAAAKLAPNDVDSLLAKAWAAYHANQLVDMEAVIQEAMRVDPNNAKTHLLHALWYGFNPERAEALAAQALERDPDLVSAYYVKAIADRKAGELGTARRALERAVELDPSFATARLELAEVLAESGDSEGALRAYRGAVAAAPDNAGARFHLAVGLRRAGRIDEAITEYQNAIRIDSELSEAYYNLAVLYLQAKQNPDLAARNFSRFLQLEPHHERAAQVRQWLEANDYR